MPGTFAGSDEMLALGLSMKGLSHGVFEMVSDHLGDDDEWMWVKGFAGETKLPVTLVATSAGAYQGDKMYNIAEEARRHGMDIRPQIAGRPTGVLHGLQSSFHVFMGHPTYKAQVAHLPHAGKAGRCWAAADPRRHPRRGKPDRGVLDGGDPRGSALAGVPAGRRAGL